MMRWKLDLSEYELPQLLKGLKPFTLQQERRESVRYQLQDSFDWALWRRGELLLYRLTNGKEYQLYDASQFPTAAPNLIYKSRKQLNFYADFSDEVGVESSSTKQLSEKLKRAIKLRALLPLHKFTLERIRFAVKNRDDKSVAWLEMITIKSTDLESNSVSKSMLQLLPVRGYDSELIKVEKVIRKTGLEPRHGSLLESNLLVSGVVPMQYQAKPDVVIKPSEETREVVLHYVKALFKVVRENEEGILADLDIEFLHDYRVSLRRIRSILTLVRKVFSVEESRWLKQQFKMLAKRTNALRDLDVYLLERKSYSALLPSTLSMGIDALFESLAKKRRREVNRVKRWLRSADYMQIVEAIEQRLDGEAELLGVGLRSERPVLAVAQQELSRHFHKVGKLGEVIDDTTPDDEVHDLRLECKQLRYLLEFFGVLFPKKMESKAIATLKKLQDNLGRFNDLSVQQESLEHTLQSEMRAKQQASPELLAALGGLIGALNLEQREERALVSASFSHFYTEQTIKLYRKMVGGAKEGGSKY
jgi:CHAD domain-containing protein